MGTLTFEGFRRRFDEIVDDLDINWEAVGFLTPDDRVFPFGTDTKVISTVFEAFVAPIIFEIAEEFKYIVEGSPQTVYPDFTLSPKSNAPNSRLAIDVKTTYRTIRSNGTIAPFRFTLGSYTSFLRSTGAAKNIKHPYEQYIEHIVIGFLYTRAPGVAAKVYERGEALKGACPYRDVVYFVQHKYKIVGVTPGSGNTANIGSFPTNDIEDLRNGRGPFCDHGKEVCDEYWRSYGRVAKDRPFNNLDGFLKWNGQR